jgi:diguanylate cyclase (GGDEF)-like protein/putative nucleotidyltransferase with HDIG domain
MKSVPEIKIKPKKTKGIKTSVIKKPLLPILIASSIAAIYLYSFLFIPVIQRAKSQFEDYPFSLRYKYYRVIAKSDLKPKDIVLVTIDEESYKQLGKRWPWGRDVFAELIDKLSAYHPKVIALDFALYGETTDEPQADRQLADAMEKAGNVIIASVYGKEKLYLDPFHILAKASAGYGVVGAIKDDDSVIRKISAFTLILTSKKGADISFEIKTAARYLDVPYDKIYRERHNVVLEAKDKRILIPTDGSGHILINYLSDVSDVDSVPIWRVMSGDMTKNKLKNKLVLVSRTGGIFHDLHSTPLGYNKPGGVIIVNVLSSIVSSNYIRRGNPFFAVPIIALIYLLSFILFYRIQPLKGFIALVLILSSYLSMSFSLFLNGILWPVFDIVILLPFLFLGMTFYKYAIMAFEGAEIRRMAITDSLTGLYTHRYFRLLLEHTANRALGFGNKCSLIVVKILNMDRVVKELSFNRGQMVQKRVAELAKMKLSKDGSAAYLGMGEFAMLLPKIGVYEALGIAGSFRNRIIEADFGISEDMLKPTAAIGVSSVNPTGYPKTGGELMRSAKAAMGRAKEIGYDKICRFNPKIDSSVFEPNAMEKAIRQRLDDKFGFLAMDLEERNKELEDLLRQLSITQRDLEQAHFETLRSLVVALEQKDPCTAGHSERVGAYAEKIGRKLNMPEEELKLLNQAAVLHDIGKVGMPQDILRKEDGLSPSERHIIELHPEFSVRILNTSKYFNKILHAIRDHHERLDGSGYPRHLKGERLSLEAQIIAICDVFDAMNTDRPYRKALSHEEALKEILSQPKKYNHQIALALKYVLEKDRKAGVDASS